MQSITKMPPEEDPAPIAPIRPDDGDCCQSGCQRCVFDLYDDAVERYRAGAGGMGSPARQSHENAPADLWPLIVQER